MNIEAYEHISIWTYEQVLPISNLGIQPICKNDFLIDLTPQEQRLKRQFVPEELKNQSV